MLFIVGLLVIIAIGLIHPLALHTPEPGRSLLPAHALETVKRAAAEGISAGCSALTGVEAIANGVPLFKQPRVARAKQTELILGGILGAMLLGLAVLADRWQIGPRSGQTVLSQIMATAIGRHWAYYVMSLTITLVLTLAANTSFGAMPLLASLLARDNYLPHRFALRDDRQVFAAGIWTLAIMSAALLIAVTGNTLRLIPLFAIGVFTGFTLAQAGMVVYWWRSRPRGWQQRAASNGIGAAATAIATLVFLVTKLTEGAWVVVLAVAALIVLFSRIHRYYLRAGHALGLGTIPGLPQGRPVIVVVPVTEVSLLTQHAISEALSISRQVIAVTVVAADPDQSTGDTRKLSRQWARWNPGVPLRILDTQYASIAGPVVAFIDELRQHRHEQILVLVPVVRPDRLRYRLLHNHLDVVLTTALRTRTDIVVARVVMQLRRRDDEAGPAVSTRTGRRSDLSAVPSRRGTRQPLRAGRIVSAEIERALGTIVPFRQVPA